MDDFIGENSMEVSCNKQKEKSGDEMKKIIDLDNMKHLE